VEFSKVCKEMKVLLILFTIEHVILCIPMFILSFNIYQRNDYLYNVYPFPPLPSEERATLTAYSLAIISPILFVAIPFLQVNLIHYFNTFNYLFTSRNFSMDSSVFVLVLLIYETKLFAKNFILLFSTGSSNDTTCITTHCQYLSTQNGN